MTGDDLTHRPDPTATTVQTGQPVVLPEPAEAPRASDRRSASPDAPVTLLPATRWDREAFSHAADSAREVLVTTPWQPEPALYAARGVWASAMWS